MSGVPPAVPSYLSALAPVLADVVAPAAVEVDRTGAYPRAALDALGRAGLLGLISAPEVGGMGEGPPTPTTVGWVGWLGAEGLALGGVTSTPCLDGAPEVEPFPWGK